MTKVGWFWVALSILGALVLSALVWLGGPLVAIGDSQPFEGVITRLLIIVLILLVVGGSIAWRILARRRAEKAIAQAMTAAAEEESDAPVLREKMEDALVDPAAHRQIGRRRALRPALVSDHRPAGRRQDDGAGQFGAEIPARRRQPGQSHPGRRRHALLRLVVHRRGGADRHRRALHDAGFRRQGRPQELALVSRDARQEPAEASRSTASSWRSASPTSSICRLTKWLPTPTRSASGSTSCTRS